MVKSKGRKREGERARGILLDETKSNCHLYCPLYSYQSTEQRNKLTTNTHFHPTSVNYDELPWLTYECVFVCETFMIANASTQLSDEWKCVTTVTSAVNSKCVYKRKYCTLLSCPGQERIILTHQLLHSVGQMTLSPASIYICPVTSQPFAGVNGVNGVNRVTFSANSQAKPHPRNQPSCPSRERVKVNAHLPTELTLN